MVQVNHFVVASFITLFAFLNKANALPGVGINLTDKNLYIICPLEETGRGDTATCCPKMKNADPVGDGIDTNCQIPIADLLVDLEGVVEYLKCCSSTVKQTHGAHNTCPPTMERDP